MQCFEGLGRIDGLCLKVTPRRREMRRRRGGRDCPISDARQKGTVWGEAFLVFLLSGIHPVVIIDLLHYIWIRKKPFK